MNPRTFLKTTGAAALLPLSTARPAAAAPFRRVRPTDKDWPSTEAWKLLNSKVGGNLIPVEFPLAVCKSGDSAQCIEIFAEIKNPYYIGDQPGITQTFGWVNAWTTKPSVYAIAASTADDIAAGVNFARENNLRLVVKGGGHSYQGTSNVADSLLIWTRYMHDVTVRSDFVPEGRAGKLSPQKAVTVGSGTIWMQAYDAVTTKTGGYVQGGGCTTVGVAGLGSRSGHGG